LKFSRGKFDGGIYRATASAFAGRQQLDSCSLGEGLGSLIGNSSISWKDGCTSDDEVRTPKIKAMLSANSIDDDQETLRLCRVT